MHNAYFSIFHFPLILNRNFTFDGGVALVVFEGKILVFETENILYFGIDFHCWERVGGAAELQFNLLYMIEIDVRVADCMDKIAKLISAHLRHHHC